MIKKVHQCKYVTALQLFGNIILKSESEKVPVNISNISAYFGNIFRNIYNF